MSCYGYGCGPLCGPVCLQCYYPKSVGGCPVNIKCGGIVPEPLAGAGNPCYGGISAPSHSCGKEKCCESSRKKVKSEWVEPGSVQPGHSCNCNC